MRYGAVIVKQWVKFRTWALIISWLTLYEGLVAVVTFGFYRPMPSLLFAIKFYSWGFKTLIPYSPPDGVEYHTDEEGFEVWSG